MYSIYIHNHILHGFLRFFVEVMIIGEFRSQNLSDIIISRIKIYSLPRKNMMERYIFMWFRKSETKLVWSSLMILFMMQIRLMNFMIFLTKKSNISILFEKNELLEDDYFILQDSFPSFQLYENHYFDTSWASKNKSKSKRCFYKREYTQSTEREYRRSEKGTDRKIQKRLKASFLKSLYTFSIPMFTVSYKP